MLPEWAVRFLIAVGITLLGWVIASGVRQMVLRRARSVASGLDRKIAGVPTILYFTTPDCVTCKVAQRPALNHLKERMGSRVQVIEINAYENPAMAKEWSVLSVPVTFILDVQGKPFHVNYGFTPVDKLVEQLRAID